MRKLKFFLALIAAFTLGEVVTVYRLQPNPGSFLSFFKEYMKNAYVQGYSEGEKVGHCLVMGDYEGAKKVVRRDVFPYKK